MHRYQAIFEHLTEGIFLFDAASKRIVEANPAFLRLLGYSVADLPTLTLYGLIAHDRASVDNNIARIIREGRNEIGERDYRRKDGVTVPVEVSGVALTSAGCAILCVVVRDLTARRQAEAQRAADEARVREGEARLLAVVEGAPILLFTVDRAGIITFARGRGLATLGLTEREVEGQSLFIAGRQFPDVLDNVRRALDGEEFTAIVAIGKHTFTTHYARRGEQHEADTCRSGGAPLRSRLDAARARNAGPLRHRPAPAPDRRTPPRQLRDGANISAADRGQTPPRYGVARGGGRRRARAGSARWGWSQPLTVAHSLVDNRPSGGGGYKDYPVLGIVLTHPTALS